MQNGRRKKQTGTRPDDDERDDSTIREEEPPLKKSVEHYVRSVYSERTTNDFSVDVRYDISLCAFAFIVGALFIAIIYTL